MRLALALGRTLAELEQTLAAAELPLWLALVDLDGPFLPQRLDILEAINSCASSFGKSSVQDWLPVWDQSSEQVTYQQGIEVFASWANSSKGTK